MRTWLFALALLPAGVAQAAPPQQVLDQGIRVTFDAQAGAQPGDATAFRFGLIDSTSGRPLSGLRPAAWLGLRRDPSKPAAECKRQIAGYLAGDLFRRADVDLNSYFVLAMNDEASISVVDPLFGFGGSKLLALLELEKPGADWQLTPERDRLFVSQPLANKVAVADTSGWRVTAQVATGPNPRQLLQNAAQVWVADDAGLTRIDKRSLATQALPLGKASGIALDGHGEHLAAAVGDSLLIVDAHDGRRIGSIALDGRPQRLAWSEAAQAFYALDMEQGRVFVVDAKQRRLRADITVDSGASQIRFAPGGRYALLPNPQRNRLQVLDASTNSIVQNADISGGPDQVSFTPLLAYVHRRDSETVQMIALDQLGQAGKPLNVAEFPAGQSALGAAPEDGADSIVAAPEGPAVLVANTSDKMIYLYREGMAAPAGGFRTYGRKPRAVLVVDHGLREGRRGEYSTRMPVTRPGTYDVALFADSPRLAVCFPFTLADTAPRPAVPRVVALAPPAELAVGQPAQLRFALLDADGARRESTDLQALALLAPGTWQRRSAPAARGDGSYELAFTPPQPGLYYVWIESNTLGLARRHRQFLIYEAK
ncbi:MAG: YncE family protein [Rhodanobacteraceae bacterium]|nr:YncE family protein [Rhodanobacteraceae bacterium]